MANRHTKAFQANCHRRVHEGFVNRADGSWSPATTNQMDLDMQAGYRVAGRLKRAKKEKKAT